MVGGRQPKAADLFGTQRGDRNNTNPSGSSTSPGASAVRWCRFQSSLYSHARVDSLMAEGAASSTSSP